MVVETALERGELTAEQHATITAVGARFEADRERRHELRERLRVAASDVVRVGTTESEVFDKAMKEAVEAMEAHMTLTADAVAEVHGALEPSQRALVGDALRERLAARYERKADRANKKVRFKKVAAHLALSGVQIDELKQLKKELIGDKKELRPTREELEALIDAFEGEPGAFRLAVSNFHGEKLELLRQGSVRVGKHADTALSLLSAEQRDVLADLIELGPEEAGLAE